MTAAQGYGEIADGITIAHTSRSLDSDTGEALRHLFRACRDHDADAGVSSFRILREDPDIYVVSARKCGSGIFDDSAAITERGKDFHAACTRVIERLSREDWGPR